MPTYDPTEKEGEAPIVYYCGHCSIWYTGNLAVEHSKGCAIPVTKVPAEKRVVRWSKPGTMEWPEE